MYAYPSLLAASKSLTLNFRACSGATVADVTSTQLGALGAGTTHVSISVGGNDAGFADVLTECAQPGWMSDCNGAIDDAQYVINNVLPSRLSTLYSSIRAKAPNARVTVVGYPRIFNGEDCNAGTWFSPTEESRLNATADLLNSKTSTQAKARGFAFANPTTAFTGHAVCDGVEWLNGLSNPVERVLPPQPAGPLRLRGRGQPLPRGHGLRRERGDPHQGRAQGGIPCGTTTPVCRRGRRDHTEGVRGPRPEHGTSPRRCRCRGCRPLQPGQHRRRGRRLLGPSGGGARSAPVTFGKGVALER